MLFYWLRITVETTELEGSKLQLAFNYNTNGVRKATGIRFEGSIDCSQANTEMLQVPRHRANKQLYSFDTVYE